MSRTLILKTAVDAFVRQGAYKTLFATTRLYVGTTAKTYLYINIPVLPISTQVVSAKLVMRAGGTLLAKTTGFPSVSVYPLTQSFNINTLSWANQPTKGAVLDTETAPKDQPSGRWEWDLTARLQSVVSGGATWYGMVLESTSATEEYFNGSWTSLPPYLEMVINETPRTPTDLRPNSGQQVYTNKPILTWNFVAASDQATAYAREVQISAAADMSSPWSSGTVLGADSMLNLASTAYAGAPAASTRYWRVRVQTSDGMWSAWSSIATFQYVTSGALAITAPAGSTTPDPTPTITWTFTGATQQAFQLLVDLVQTTDAGLISTRRHDSGVIFTANKTYTIPTWVYRQVNETLKITLRVWDTNNAAQSNGPVTNYKEVTKNLQWVPTGTPAPVNITATGNAPYPHYTISWTMPNTAADAFAIWRKRHADGPNVNGEIVGWVYRAGGDTTTVNFSWTDYLVGGRSDVTWEVQAIDYGVGASIFNPSVTKTVRNNTPWIIPVGDTSLDRAVALVNADIDPGLSDISDVVRPIDGDPFVVYQGFNMMIGTGVGELANGVTTKTAEEMKRDFLWMREHPRVYLVWADLAIECFLYDCEYKPLPTADGKTDYIVSFGFLQVRGDEQ